MKKLFLLILTILFLSGCSIQKIDTNDYISLMNKILSYNVKYKNKVNNGYDYYLPKGVVRIESNKYNDILRRDSTKYYLYVDVVSYFYKSDITYKQKSDLYYSGEIKNGDNKGYLQIEEIHDKKNKLYVQMSYNYAKIETYVDKKNLSQAISDLSYILSSISFNDVVLAKEYSSDNPGSKEETYKLFEDKEKNGNFLEYIKEYDKYDEEKASEEAELKLEKSSSKTTTSAN